MVFNVDVYEESATNTENYIFDPDNKASSVKVNENDKRIISISLEGEKPVGSVGMFNWLGKNSIVAPGIQHQFSVSGKDVSRTVLDLYFVYMLAKGKNWLIVNPQPIYDWENETEFAQVDFEWGFMIAKASGVAGYVRPGLGIGADRPFDYNFEFGIKFIWR